MSGDRYAMNWLLVTAMAVIAPLAWQLPGWVTAATVALLLWRYLATHHAWPLPGRVMRLLVTGAFLLGVYKGFGTLLGREAGIALLTGLLALKLWELRGPRDYVLALLLMCVLILGSFLYNQSPWLALYLMACVILVVAALFRVQQPSGVLWRERLRLALELTAKALPLMLALYLLFPRIQGGLWGLPRDAYAGMTGLSDVMNPGAISHLSESSAVAFRVEPASLLPPEPERYWRALVLNHTDGRAWTRRVNAAMSGLAASDRKRIEYSITLEPTDQPWLIALDYPLAVEGATLSRDLTASADGAVQVRRRYRATSVSTSPTVSETAADRAVNLQLPPTVSPRVRALAEQWRRSNANPLAIAQAALNYFRTESFYYTLSPPPLHDDPVDEFMFTARQGFCEHFAAAFATLMRVAGVPARVVTGYQGGEVNPNGDYLIVRQSDAHAWDEIWVDGRGWIRIDPTAAVAPERINLGYDAVRRLERKGMQPRSLSTETLLAAIRPDAVDRFWHRTGLLADAAARTWNGWVLDYNPQRQRELMSWLGFRTPTWLTLVATLLGAVVVLVLVLAALILHTRTRRSPAERAYDDFCRLMARLGIVRTLDEAPLAYAARCARARPDLADLAGSITRHYVETRYGAHVTPTQLLALQRHVRALRVAR